MSFTSLYSDTFYTIKIQRCGVVGEKDQTAAISESEIARTGQPSLKLGQNSLHAQNIHNNSTVRANLSRWVFTSGSGAKHFVPEDPAQEEWKTGGGIRHADDIRLLLYVIRNLCRF